MTQAVASHFRTMKSLGKAPVVKKVKPQIQAA
jgi:hypothetical protein